VLAHRLAVALAPRACAGTGAAVNVSDPPVAELDEVPHDMPRPRTLVRLDRVDLRRADVACDDDHRRHGRDGEDVTRRRPGSDEHDAVGTKLEEGLERRLLAAGTPSCGPDQHAIVVLGGALFDPVHDLGVEGVVELVEEHSDGSGPLAREPTRHRVRPIPQLLGCAKDACPPRVAHLRAAAHHQRHQGA
jgi:hypothetical protein